MVVAVLVSITVVVVAVLVSVTADVVIGVIDGYGRGRGGNTIITVGKKMVPSCGREG